jgi:hypothetical protein
LNSIIWAEENWAALGQGNFDAVAVIFGMVGGAYLFAATPDLTARNSRQGNRGRLNWPELLNVRERPFIAGFAAILLLALFGLERL